MSPTVNVAPVTFRCVIIVFEPESKRKRLPHQHAAISEPEKVRLDAELCRIIWWRQVHDDVIKWKHIPRYWPFVRGEFPVQRPVTRSFAAFFDLCPNIRLSKQSWGWWFETLSRPLWRNCDDRDRVRLFSTLFRPNTKENTRGPHKGKYCVNYNHAMTSFYYGRLLRRATIW